METIKIQYLNDEVKRLEYIGGKSDWIDLRSAEHVVMKKGEFHLIPLGVAMQLPKGVVDESYAGPNDWWYMPAYALRDTEIQVNDRICQFRIMEHQPQLVFEEQERLAAPDRGGIGSTGKN